MGNTVVLGAGGWGLALSMVAMDAGQPVTVWSFSEEELRLLRLHNENRRCLPGVSLPEGLLLTGDLSVAAEAELVVMAVPSFAIRQTARQLRAYIRPGTVVVNAGKGLEEGTCLRFSQVLEEELPGCPIVVLSGPSHAEEVARQVPTTVTVSSADPAAAEWVQHRLSRTYFRLYVNEDLIGVELGGALKNPIALAAGILDGLDLGDNTKAALMTRGLVEIARLGMAMGAQERTFAGLSGMGDLMVTCGSMHSRNRRAGILIGQGVPVEEAIRRVGTVEGYCTVRPAYALAQQRGVEMPILEQCYRICYEGQEPRLSVAELFGRPLCYESEKTWIR